MSLADLLLSILNAFMIVLVARALFSWFDPTYQTVVGRFLFSVTEPVVGPVRQIIPTTGMLDLSVMVTMFLIIILRQLVASTL
ncbi:MAG TPA: YggT family protein [Thermomicrobiales bacterium]|nr:YggT family protein [Thermomicrobiales bacterium]